MGYDSSQRDETRGEGPFPLLKHSEAQSGQNLMVYKKPSEIYNTNAGPGRRGIKEKGSNRNGTLSRAQAGDYAKIEGSLKKVNESGPQRAKRGEDL